MRRYALALGFFDGVHTAHRAVLAACADYAAAHDLTPAAVTFDHHPQSALRGTKESLIQTLPDRVASLTDAGMQDVFLLPFGDVKIMPWDDFVRDILIDTYHAGCVVTGYDFRFGRGGEGTVEKLKAALAEHDIPCTAIPRMTADGVEYASTTIRTMLGSGDMAGAARLLGRHYAISGVVRHGKALGRTIGTPTANVAFDDVLLLPRCGVYCSYVTVDRVKYEAVTNVAPAKDGVPALAESFLFDFDGDLYGKTVTVELLEFVRDMLPFSGVAWLKERLERDKETARAYFEGRKD